MAAGDWREILGRTLVGTALLFLIMVTDPMGLDAASDRHSADVVSRITAPFYGGPRYEGRGRIAVVQISDRAVNESEGWPPTRTYYARLLKRVAGGDKKPAVIFFDYAFISRADPEDRRILLDAIRSVTAYELWGPKADCQASVLAKLKCMSDAGGVPVVVGKVYPPNACLSGLKRSVWDDGDDVRMFHTAAVVPLGWPELPTTFHVTLTRGDYTRALTEALDGEAAVALKRPGDRAAEEIKDCEDLSPGPDWAPLGRGSPKNAAWDPLSPGGPVFGYDISPAAAMAYGLCLHDAKNHAPWKDDAKAALCDAFNTAVAAGAEPRLEDIDYAGPEWGSIGDPLNLKYRQTFYPGQKMVHEAACAKEQANVGHAITVGWSQLRSGLGKGAAAVAVPCPYHFTVDASPMTGGEPAELDWIRAQLAGRAVAIGAAQALSNDWIATTLNAQQAGVHYHAMLLDNLLEKGLDLRRQPQDLIDPDGPLGWSGLDWLGLDLGELLELACAILILFLIERTRSDIERRRDVMIARAAEADQDHRLHTEETPPPKLLLRARQPDEPPALIYWLAAQRLAYRDYWKASGEDRWRIGQVSLTLALAAIVMVLATGLTIANRWEPLNIVGLFGFTLAAVAFELWSQKGWLAVVGQGIAAVVLLSSLRRHKFFKWFGRPPEGVADEPEPEQPPPAPKPKAARRKAPAAAKPKTPARPRNRRKDSP